MHRTWSRFVIVALVSGLCLAAYSVQINPAAAAPAAKDDPFAGVTQNWDKVLPAAQRFAVLPAFNNEAVRDNNTGLVWQKSPASTSVVHNVAAENCIDKTVVGGQKGWRLPSAVELASLLDPSVSGGQVALPLGHPFLNVQPSLYWSATTFAEDQSAAWFVDFGGSSVRTAPKAQTWHFWCVRGPMNADKY
jgi:hypothetical protein